MYSIFADDLCIYHDISPLENVKVINPVLTLEDSAAGSLTMTVPPTNVGYNFIKRMVTDIYVYKNGKEIWQGRVLNENADFYNNRVLYCEGELSFLNDSIQPQAVYHNFTVRGFFQALIDNHNAKVSDSKKFYVGAVTVTDPNDSLYRYTNFETTIECINDKLIDRLGGHIQIRKVNGKRYIDYLSDLPNTNSQVIQFGSNLLDFTRTWDLSDLATTIMPLGARLEENEIEALDSYLTVESVNHEAMVKGPSPLSFTSDGTALRDIIIHGSKNGAGSKTKNLFNKNDYDLQGLYPNATDGHVSISGESGATWARSLVLEVEPETRYIFSMESPSGGSKLNRNRMRIGCYPEYPRQLLMPEIVYDNIVRNGSTVYSIFTTGKETRYILVFLWVGSQNYTDEEIQETISSADIQLEKQSVMTISGSPPFTFRSYGKRLTDYFMFGNSSGLGDLDETSGKYIIPISIESKNILVNALESQTYNGITISVNEDKSIIVDGTADEDMTFYLHDGSHRVSNQILQTIKNDAYILTGSPEGASSETCYMAYLFKKTMTTSSQTVVVPSEGASIDNTEGNYRYFAVSINVKAGAQVNKLIFRPMLRKQGDEGTYEPQFSSTSQLTLDSPLYSGQKLTLADTGIDIKTGICTCTMKVNTSTQPVLMSIEGPIEPTGFVFSISYEPFGYKIQLVLRDSSGNVLFRNIFYSTKQLYSDQKITLSGTGKTAASVNGKNILTAYADELPGALEVRYNSVQGSPFVMSEDAVSNYGRIEKVVNWDDVTTPQALMRKAKQYLSQAQFDKMKIELSAIDLHYLNVNFEDVKLLDSIKVFSPPHGLDRFFPVSKLQIPLDNPGGSVFTLGTDINTSLTSSSSRANMDILNIIERLPKKSAILEEAKANATAIMNLSTKGYITITNDDNGSNALYVSNTRDYREATKFWKLCMDGFGYSGDGGRTFGLAMTMDGAIVADYITAGVLNGELLRAGSVTANAISQSFKDTITSDINNAKTTITQEFTAADGALRSAIERSISETYATKTSLQQTSDSITTEVSKKVNSSEFRTYMQQNYDSFLLGFNSNSSIIKIATTGIGFYNGEVNAANRVARLNRYGMELWRNGNRLGIIGTDGLVGYDSCRGLSFDLEYAGNYMSWCIKTSASDDVFTQVLAYSRGAPSYDHAGLQLGAPLYARGCEINNANLTQVRTNGSETFTGTKTFITAIRETENGIEWDGETFTIINGMFVN